MAFSWQSVIVASENRLEIGAYITAKDAPVAPSPD